MGCESPGRELTPIGPLLTPVPVRITVRGVSRLQAKKLGSERMYWHAVLLFYH
jgi:hypothetical protein